jgi:hypothetical protein
MANCEENQHNLTLSQASINIELTDYSEKKKKRVQPIMLIKTGSNSKN